MPDWLTNLLPAIAGLAGVLLGVWMTQRGAEKLSKQTLDGQLALANGAAQREWRRQQVQPFLDAADQRVHFWLERMLATDVARWPWQVVGVGDDFSDADEVAKLYEAYSEAHRPMPMDNSELVERILS